MTQPRPRAYLSELAVLAVIVAVTLAITFPLILHLGDLIPGFPGDNLYFFWELWWFKRALLDLHVSPFVDYELYYPVGLELARDEVMPANTVLGLPLTAFLGTTISYNLLVFGSFVLSGYAVYRFVYEATDDRLAALMGGLAFAIAPYRMMRFFGHLNLLATQWLVLTLLFLERFLRFRRPVDGALAGIWFGLNALAAWYYLYIGAVAVIVFATIRTLPWRESLRERRLWRGAAWFVVVAGLLITPFAIPYLQLRESGELQRYFIELDGWSANLTDFLQPNPLHPIWGKAIRQIFPFQWKTGIERNLMLGWSLLGLAIVGACAHRRNRTAQALALLAVASLILALGPTLHWDSQRVEYALPKSVVQFAEQTGVTTMLASRFDPALAEAVRAGRGFIPLPAMAMYAVIPLTSSIRAILRFGLVTLIAIAILAGYGMAVLLRAVPKRSYARQTAMLAIGGLVIFELWSAIPDEFPHWTQIQARPVDAWLAAQSDQAVIVEYPFVQNFEPSAMMYQTFNRQRMVLGGKPPSFRVPSLSQRVERLKSFPSREALAALHEYGTRYVLVTPALLGSATEWKDLKSKLDVLPGLQLINDIDGVLVYEIKYVE